MHLLIAIIFRKINSNDHWCHKCNFPTKSHRLHYCYKLSHKYQLWLNIKCNALFNHNQTIVLLIHMLGGGFDSTFVVEAMFQWRVSFAPSAGGFLSIAHSPFGSCSSCPHSACPLIHWEECGATLMADEEIYTESVTLDFRREVASVGFITTFGVITQEPHKRNNAITRPIRGAHLQ